MAIKYLNQTTGEFFTTPIELAPTKKTRKKYGVNNAGFTFRRAIAEWLTVNPYKTLREIHAQFPDLNFHSLRYNVSKAVELGVFGMQGKAKSAGKETPRYFVIQQKQIDVAALLKSIE